MSTRTLPHGLGRALPLAFGITVLCTMFSGVASAQVFDRTTVVTFSAPVEIPGAGPQILPAGTYVFKLVKSYADRHIVQIFSQNEQQLYATILAIPNLRLHPTDQTVMTFAERAAGQPQAIRAWFYPGDNWGQEFVYRKAEAVELARVTQAPVLYLPDDAPRIVAPVTTPPEPAVAVLAQQPVKAVTPTGQDIPVSAVVEPPPPPAAPQLPKAAGELPLLALLGLLSLSLGIGLGLVRRSPCAH